MGPSRLELDRWERGGFLSGVVTKARGCGHSGSDGGTPFASVLWAPSETSFSFPTAELQLLILGTLSRLQDQPHGASREPNGVPAALVARSS
ncbi:hypothetical protein DV515_00016543 [Chloebia gouldiae]|uniref:Uncharacterized protein n=1 Tax=Chloebia gouldiae TaxID=44316 RepID=A0A3L8RSN1_CHLGU|nr:hypothetical protein DV515_00016543 [Chloebia gouldiae]